MKKPIVPKRAERATKPERTYDAKVKTRIGNTNRFTIEIVTKKKDPEVYLRQISAWRAKEEQKDKDHADAMRLYDKDKKAWDDIHDKIKDVNAYKVGDGAPKTKHKTPEGAKKPRLKVA